MENQNFQRPIATVIERCCNSERTLSKFVYTWVIKDFRASLVLAGEELHSALFDEEASHKLQWQLVVTSRPSAGEMYFSLRQIVLNPPTVFLAVEFAIMNPKRGKDYVALKSFKMNAVDRNAVFTCNYNTILASPNKFIYDDKLTLRFVVSLANDDVVSNTLSTDSLQEPSVKFRESLGHLLDHESFADVTIIVGSESFQAHKVILAAQSDVFVAMLQHDMLENANNQIKITDIRPEVFRETLHFIYTGKVRDESVLERMALELIVVADKYDLGELKNLCEATLIRNISSRTAAETLIVAETHRVEKLEMRAIEFIKANIAEVSLTSIWCKLLSSYAHLVELFSTKSSSSSRIQSGN